MFTTPRLVAIALCAALNFAIGNVVYLVKLPIYLDSIGTILCALLIFPDRLAAICCAFIAGFIGVILSGLVINPFLPWFSFTVLAIVLVSALLTARATETFRARPLQPLPFFGKVVDLRRHHRHRVGDRLGAGRGLSVRRRHRQRQRLRGRVLPQDRRAAARTPRCYAGLTTEPIDKTLQVLVAALLYRATPREFIAMLRPAQPGDMSR